MEWMGGGGGLHAGPSPAPAAAVDNKVGLANPIVSERADLVAGETYRWSQSATQIQQWLSLQRDLQAISDRMTNVLYCTDQKIQWINYNDEQSSTVMDRMTEKRLNALEWTEDRVCKLQKNIDALIMDMNYSKDDGWILAAEGWNAI